MWMLPYPVMALIYLLDISLKYGHLLYVLAIVLIHMMPVKNVSDFRKPLSYSSQLCTICKPAFTTTDSIKKKCG